MLWKRESVTWQCLLLALTMIVSWMNQVLGSTISVDTILPNNVTLVGFQVTAKNSPVDVYLRIPYAKPPIAELRFQQPQKLQIHPGSRLDVRQPPPTCYQDVAVPPDENAALLMWYNNTELSEDCLYLSVWAPHVPSNQRSVTPKLPVMVWIYGGSFTSGSNALEVYNGTYLAASQRVIVVSMQYRVGVLGFLYHSTGSEAVGNQGLWDQNLALQWVSENIESFHGDPKRVTLFGESAGAASVGFHLLSPYSEHLFKNAILQSASAFAHWATETPAEAFAKANLVSQRNNCPTFSQNPAAALRCMQNLPVEQLWRIAENETKTAISVKRKEFCQRINSVTCEPSLSGYTPYLIMTFTPVIDGIFVPSSPQERMRQLQSERRISSPKRTIIVGIMKNESNFFLLYPFSHLFNSSPTNSSKMEENVRLMDSFDPQLLLGTKILPMHLTKLPLLTAMAFQYGIPINYLGASRTQMTPSQMLNLFDSLAGDLDFRCPTLDFGRALQDMGHKLYVYEFRQRSSYMPYPEWVGTMHGYEIEYIFGQPFNPNFQNKFYKFSQEEQILSEKVMQYWANVAKYDDPNGALNKITWPAYTVEQPSNIQLEITKTGIFNVGQNLRRQECLFWRKVIPSLEMHLKTCSGSQRSLTASQVISASFLLMFVIIHRHFCAT